MSKFKMLRAFLLFFLPAFLVAEFQFKQSAFMVPHPQKAYRGGQDAYFSSKDLLVVADGVGGWNNQGIDPSQYSRFLCKTAGKLFENHPQFYRRNPIELIIKCQESNTNVGSSTMVVVTLEENQLNSCYIGDSGFLVLRPSPQDKITMLIFQFKQQQHSFNFPYQLALDKYGGDDPQKSLCFNIKVKEGDIVVVGSDGIFDNVFTSQIVKMVHKANADGTLLNQLPKKIANLAIQRGQNPNFNSPFAVHAKQSGLKFMGGKLDDSTIIIAKIQENKQEQEQEQTQSEQSNSKSV